MNHAPQYAIGQEVVTPRHGAGVIKWIYPTVFPKKVRNQYSVIVKGRREALLLSEKQLQPRPCGAPDPEVRCRDCNHNSKVMVRTSILCPVMNKYRKVDEPRLCKNFTPRQPTEGA